MVAQSRDETEPLLGSADNARGRSAASKKMLILVVCSIFVLALDFGFYLGTAPQTQIFEQIICRKYQADLQRTGGITHGDPCKSEAVQGELALVIGLKDTFEGIPSILFSLPYGVLSDHWGRKPVMGLALLGLILGELWVRLVCWWSNVLPLRVIWFSGLFRLIGGGDMVLSTIALVMIADIFTEEEVATALFRLTSCVTLAEVLATPISAYLMTSFNLWFPYILGIGIVIVGVIPVYFLPETLEDAKAKKRSQVIVTEDDDDDDDDDDQTQPPGNKTMRDEFISKLREFIKSTQFIWKDLNVCLTILICFVSFISKQSTNILMQYASKKFHWSIARASLLISLRGTFMLINFLLLMPTTNFLLAKYLHLHGKWRDLHMSQGSGLLAIIGFAAIFVAPVPAILIFGLVILSLGSTFPISSRSLATAIVQPDHVGTLYSAIAVAQSVGLLVSGPLFAGLFRLGLHLGDAWMGLPFLQAALFYVVACVAVSCIRLRSSQRNGQEEEQEPL